MTTPITYQPQIRVKGYSYWKISRLMEVILHIGPSENDRAKTLASDVLTRRPYGLELRNEYLLPLRLEMQGWHHSALSADDRTGTAHFMMKILFDRLLADTTIDRETGIANKFNPQLLTLETLIAFDQSKMLSEAVVARMAEQ
jgi:hypothetical protein